MSSSAKLGATGEEVAANYLKNKGYMILVRNFRSKSGEIDIIALGQACVVFVEVKSRATFGFGRPIESINAKKLSKMIKTAQYYLSQNKGLPSDFRLDAIEVVSDGAGKFSIVHTENITI